MSFDVILYDMILVDIYDFYSRWCGVIWREIMWIGVARELSDIKVAWSNLTLYYTILYYTIISYMISYSVYYIINVLNLKNFFKFIGSVSCDYVLIQNLIYGLIL